MPSWSFWICCDGRGRRADPDPEEGRGLQGGELARDTRLGLLLRLAGARLADVAPDDAVLLVDRGKLRVMVEVLEVFRVEGGDGIDRHVWPFL